MSGHHRTNKHYLHTFKNLTCQINTRQTLLVSHIPKSYMSCHHRTDQHYLHHTFKNLMCKVTTGQTLPVLHIPKSHMSGHHRTDQHYLHHTFKNLTCQVTTGQTNTTFITHSKILHIRSPQDRPTLLTSHIQKSYMSGQHRTNQHYLHHTFKNLTCQVTTGQTSTTYITHSKILHVRSPQDKQTLLTSHFQKSDVSGEREQSHQISSKTLVHCQTTHRKWMLSDPFTLGGR